MYIFVLLLIIALSMYILGFTHGVYYSVYCEGGIENESSSEKK